MQRITLWVGTVLRDQKAFLWERFVDVFLTPDNAGRTPSLSLEQKHLQDRSR